MLDVIDGAVTRRRVEGWKQRNKGNTKHPTPGSKAFETVELNSKVALVR